MDADGDYVIAHAGHDVPYLRVQKEGDEIPFPDGAAVSFSEPFRGVTLAVERNLYLHLVARYLAEGETRTFRLDMRTGYSHGGVITV